MARKIWLLIRFGFILSLFLVLWNSFWMLRLHQQKQESPKVPPSPVPVESRKDVDFGIEKNHSSALRSETKPYREIQIVAVVCGNRINETLVMMKSALITRTCNIRFILFADDFAISTLNQTVKLWPENVLDHMQLDLRPITFPEDKAEEWKKLFKPCASQRLFLPVSYHIFKYDF